MSSPSPQSGSIILKSLLLAFFAALLGPSFDVVEHTRHPDRHVEHLAKRRNVVFSDLGG